MKKLILSITALSFIALFSCGDDSNTTDQPANSEMSASDPATPTDIASADPNRGMGKFKDVEVGPMDEAMAASGSQVYEVKCASCHKLSDEKLVGPGWAGVTERHAPEWIMNFVTNTDEMLDKDPKAQSMLEICLVRMPNQNINDADARGLLEFMRKNDGVK